MTVDKKNLDIGAVRIHPTGNMRTLFIYLASALMIVFCGYETVQAQVQLERISITERADGRGYVVRNHLSASPDSFLVSQPEVNRIQFLIYAEDLDTENFQQPELFSGLSEIRYYVSDGYFGYEFYFLPNATFRPFAYFDVNQRHVLINLERTTLEALERTDYAEAFLFKDEEQIDEADSDDDVEVTLGRERVQGPIVDRADPPGERFQTMIGIKGGYTFANFYGVGYGRNSRTGIAVAATVVTDLPFELPYSIFPGIETGIYYMQKGFEDPQANKYIADRIEIDYVEIPVLLKLNYSRANRFSPHLLFGPYLSFMVSSEQVIGEDEIRRDLDEITRNMDLGWAFGAGVDITLGNVIFDIQLRNSLSFDTLFTDEEFDDGEKLRQFSLLLGIRF